MYIKCINETKTKYPITMLKNSKSENLKKFEQWKEYGPHWINFTILNFMNENNRYLKAYIKFGTKLLHLTWEKKK
jgi:hypothetical protein